MGVEAFGLSMRLVNTGDCERMLQAVKDFDHFGVLCKDVVQGFETITGEYNDGIHVVDIQIQNATATNQCSLAMRFSLCSYESIDPVFIELVRKILTSFDADTWLMTSAIRKKNHYLPGDTRWLIAALPDEIAEMRRYWQNHFGMKQGTVRVKDSFSFVGVVKNG